MNKLLCFGAVCHMMLIFANKDVINNQGLLVSQYIGVIDPDNQILKIDEKEEEELDSAQFNSSVVSRILSGKRTLKLSKKFKVSNINISDLIKNFNVTSSSWFVEENKRLLSLTLLEIIKEDEYIDKHESSFEKFFGMTKEEFLSQKKYIFGDLMVQVLLYTTLSNIDDKIQKECVKGIYNSLTSNTTNKKTRHLMENNNLLTEYIREVANKYPNDIYYWDVKSEALTFLKNGEIVDNGSIIEKPLSEVVTKVPLVINISSNDETSKKDIKRKPTYSYIAVEEKYMTCRYCNKVELNIHTLNNDNDPYLGKCSVSGDYIYKYTEKCEHFYPNYKDIPSGPFDIKTLKNKFFR